MEISEYGNKKQKKIILIHGFETPHQVWQEYIEYYKNQFHIIIPILAGHNPNESEDFISFDKSATELENFYIEKYGNNVYAVYGMSMGGVLASKIWQNGKININKLILDSSPLVSYNGFISWILTKQYLMLTHKTQTRDKKVVQQAVGSIISKRNLEDFLIMLDNMSDTTIINYIREVGIYKLPINLSTTNVEITYYYGTKINELLAKKTAKYIAQNYPNANIIRLDGKGHCEDALFNPNDKIKELNKVLI